MTVPRPDEAATSEYSLDELAQTSGVSQRTIRYYQSLGLLTRPAHRGNRAVYSAAHLVHLQAITQLQGEGLRLQTIRSMLNGADGGGTRVVDLLGPNVAGSAWLQTSARTFDEGGLADLLGDAYPDQVSALVSAGYLERRAGPDRGVWFAASVPQLLGALELLRLGTAIELSAWSADRMRSQFRQLCEEFAVKWISESGRLYTGDATQQEFEANLETIRAVTWQSAAHVMAEEIEKVIHRVDEIRDRLQADGARDAPPSD